MRPAGSGHVEAARNHPAEGVAHSLPVEEAGRIHLVGAGLAHMEDSARTRLAAEAARMRLDAVDLDRREGSDHSRPAVAVGRRLVVGGPRLAVGRMELASGGWSRGLCLLAESSTACV